MRRQFRNLSIISLIIFCNLSVYAQKYQTGLKLSDIHIRDPYILPDASTKTYYLYKSASYQNSQGATAGGVAVYKSKDMNLWEGPIQVFRVPENNALTGIVWAPEVHYYKGKYYLFATLNSDIVWKKAQKNWPAFIHRSTQIFHSKSPEGPFLPFGIFPHTPSDEMALDGTLWVEDGIPYMIYCHEWVQVNDGTMKLVQLSPNLSKTVGSPSVLFSASAADWSTGSIHAASSPTSYVTDGCFLYRTKTGKLLMIWSSFKEGDYAVGIAESVTGQVKGPWKQQKEPIFSKNGGHGMIFKTFDGRLCITLHQPNSPGGKERARIFELEDTGNTLLLKKEITSF